MRKADWIKFAIKKGDKYETDNGGWSKDINKAYLYDYSPLVFSAKHRVVAIKIIREEVEQ